MSFIRFVPAALAVLAAVASIAAVSCSRSIAAFSVPLPLPTTDGTVSLEEALSTRRSDRSLATTTLSRQLIGQLLWAAQGVTNDEGHRTAPSAGARYPLELYVALPDGWFHYEPAAHALRPVSDDDQRAVIGEHVYGSAWLPRAPAIFVVAAVFARTEEKYGKRARRYVHIEVGHAAQNLLLQATALGLSGVGIGALDDRMQAALPMPKSHEPLYVIPVGHPGG